MTSRSSLSLSAAPVASLVSFLVAGTLSAQFTGPSSSAAPYLLPSQPTISTTSLLTVGDTIGGYRMVGIPDGMGAYDNGNGTFTLLMNHELGATQGVTRAHGGTGAFVSQWTIDKTTLQVSAGSDLINNVQVWNGSTFQAGVGSEINLARLCSGDLAPTSAFSFGGTGTTSRIFLSGEETGPEGRAFAHVATGASAGTSYQLPYLGRFSWENAVASPFGQSKTVVVGTDDTGGGQVYVYVGNKQSSGNEVEKAGLQGGTLYGIKIDGGAVQVETTAAGFDGVNGNEESLPFSLVSLGDASGLAGSTLHTNSNTSGVSEFLRPEDAHWDPSNPNRLFFVTTDSFAGKSRLYSATFTDINDPTLGGNVSMLLEGAEGQKMMDNITVTPEGKVIIQEDPGNQAHLAKIWEYDIAGDSLLELASHDANLFVTGGSGFLTQDEESSGVIDVTDIMGGDANNKWFVVNVQAHYSIPGELVQGGQILLVNQIPEPSTYAAIAGIGALGLCLWRRRR